MRREYHKLVRDLIPQIIKDQGETPQIRHLSGNEYQQALLSKLEEEMAEFKQDGSLEEFCDVLEVLEAIAAAKGFSKGDIDQTKTDKALKRGGFAEGIFLEHVDEQ